jgi:hypothetical protein
MKLEEVWSFLLEEHKKICGTHKLYVELKEPTSAGTREGYIYDADYGGDGTYDLQIDCFSDLDIEVENVWCPFCVRMIWPRD